MKQENEVKEKLTFFIPVKTVTSLFAKWAIQQSPYTVPDDLEKAILKFHARIEEAFQENLCMNNEWLQNIPRQTLYNTLQAIIVNEGFTEVYQWNERKNGNNASIGFSSRYSRTNPDDDFIDLHALSGNICRDVWEQGKTEEAEQEEPQAMVSDGPETCDGSKQPYGVVNGKLE